MTADPPRLPAVSPEAAPWWEATRTGRLLIQRCRVCRHAQHYPRALCTACGGTDLGFAPASGRGRVYSFTVVHRAPDPAFTPPYVVALVRLEEGPRLLTRVVDCPPEAVRCELPVEVAWEPLPDGRRLPVFRPAAT